MALYTNDSKERVRDAVDMVDLVSSRTELRRAGANRMTGLCPFHDERTPSFGINPVEKVYYCFGCQASGDAFTFVMETEGVDFKGALELLADRFNVALELEEEDPRAAEKRKRRERLLELLERTATFYVRQLWESREAERARAYLAERGLEEATLREFRVGYAPSAWDTVLKARCARASRRPELYDAGLVAGQRAQRAQDLRPLPLADHLPARRPARARARLRGPHARRRGRPPAEVRQQPRGRPLPQGPPAVRAPTSRARAAAKAGFVVAAEGYTDVIAMHQVGVRNCVGIMGTALTDDQIDELQRLAPEVRLALDADNAGKEAMLRAARVALGRNPPLRLRVVALPAGEDPADLVKRGGGDEIRERVEESVPFVRFRVLQALDTGDLATPRAATASADELAEVFSLLGPSAEREELRRIAADRLDMSPELLEQRLPRGSGSGRAGGRLERRGGVAATHPGRRPPARTVAPRSGAASRPSGSFLALCIALPALGAPALAELDLEADLTSAFTRRAAEHLREHLDAPTTGLADDDPLLPFMRELAVGDARAAEADAGGVRDRAPAAHARAAGPRDRGRPRRGERRHLRARRAGRCDGPGRSSTGAVERSMDDDGRGAP